MKSLEALKNERGLTLVELTMVVILIGIIYASLASGIFSKGESAKAQLNMSRMQKLKGDLGTYRFQYNTYPSRLEQLVKGGGNKKSGKLFTPIVGEEELKDIWGFPYVYKSESNGRSFSLSSYGSDGVAGGEGPNQDVTVNP